MRFTLFSIVNRIRENQNYLSPFQLDLIIFILPTNSRFTTGSSISVSAVNASVICFARPDSVSSLERDKDQSGTIFLARLDCATQKQYQSRRYQDVGFIFQRKRKKTSWDLRNLFLVFGYRLGALEDVFEQLPLINSTGTETFRLSVHNQFSFGTF